MEEYVRMFLDLINWNPKINIHLFKNKNDLHKARINMTKDEFIKEHLKSAYCMHPEGTYIIPPVSDDEYDILLVKLEDSTVYNLWHEMVHIWNYHNNIKKVSSYLDMLSNPTYFNWDEFQARKMSTIMWFTYLERTRGESIASQESFDKLAKLLQNEIKDTELVDEEVFRYNLMQYLGFVSGIREVYNNLLELPDFIQKTPVVLSQYNKLNKK